MMEWWFVVASRPSEVLLAGDGKFATPSPVFECLTSDIRDTLEDEWLVRESGPWFMDTDRPEERLLVVTGQFQARQSWVVTQDIPVRVHDQSWESTRRPEGVCQ